MRWTIRALAALLVFFWLVPEGAAAVPVNRKVLFLYSSWQDESTTALDLSLTFQTALDYYGILPDYLDLYTEPPPEDGEMERYRGIIVYMPLLPPAKLKAYLSWMDRQAGGGKKLVVLGHVGASLPGKEDPDVIRLKAKNYRHLGLDYTKGYTIDQTRLRFAHKDTERVEFERRYPDVPTIYEKFSPETETVKTSLAIEIVDEEDSRSSVIVTGPSGGFAYDEYILWMDPVSEKQQWYLDPFRFFSEALELGGIPVPDPTTLNGMRVAFSHIDADGFSNISRIDDESFCARILTDEVLKEYDFPMSVSVITGEIDPAASGSAALVALAREIFALPNIEPASHSFSHPFYWDPFSEDRNLYASASGLNLGDYSFDPESEIDDSLEYINRELVPPGKTSRLFFWTGNCLPRESDIARCEALGCLNINGGDTVLDDVNNSYTSVAPLYRKVGKSFQYYPGQANDNIMTNLWTDPKYGYRHIITTMERTGSPYRLKPIDVYYHFFSAEYPSSLSAVKTVYDWVLTQDIAPVFTSDYLRMVRGCIDTEIVREDVDRYLIRGYGECLSMRFDNEERGPDLHLSENVLGYSRQPQGLFISLSPGSEEATIVLRDSPGGGEGVPYLHSATGWVEDFQRSEDGIRFAFRGYRQGRMEIAGLPPSTAVALRSISSDRIEQKLVSDERGFLKINDISSGRMEIALR